MSVNVNINLTVAVPLETVAAILSTSAPNSTNVDLPQVNTNQAIIAAVTALPYEIKAKPTEPKNSAGHINLAARDFFGKVSTIKHMLSTDKTSALAEHLEAFEGVPKDKHILVCSGNKIWSNGGEVDVDMSLDEASISDGTTVHIVNKVDPTYSINVTVKTLTGKEIAISIPSNASASQLASRVQDKYGMPPDQQALLFNGKQIFRDRGDDSIIDISLDEACVVDGSVVHLLSTFRGS